MNESDLLAYLKGVYDGQRIINSSLEEFDQSCIQKTPELTRLYEGELQSSLSKIMTSHYNGMNNYTADVIYRLDDLVYGALKNCTGISQIEFETRVQPTVNNTHWVFNNTEGMEVDLSVIP